LYSVENQKDSIRIPPQLGLCCVVSIPLHCWDISQQMSIQDEADEGTLLIYHTLHSPRWNSGPEYWEHDTYLSQHVNQLNAVGRHVAQSLHYHILDLDLMAAQVWH
jgi:hypothetical protein